MCKPWFFFMIKNMDLCTLSFFATLGDSRRAMAKVEYHSVARSINTAAGRGGVSRGGMDGRSVVVGGDEGWRKGPWSAQEDGLLVHHVNLHGEGKWNSVAKSTGASIDRLEFHGVIGWLIDRVVSGLRRSGKSCRLRWVNYLRPDLKRGSITPEEEIVIQHLHALWGNRYYFFLFII